jgi:hypothetical protein
MGAFRHRRLALECCPACAASARPVSEGLRARADHGGVPAAPRWAWLAVLGVAAALVPVAAWRGGPGALALEPAPAPVPPAAEVAAARPATVPFHVTYRRSVASGLPQAGRLVGGVQLPPVGPGYYTYDPSSSALPNAAGRRWGTETLVRQLVALGAWWERAHPGAPRIGVGDMSRREGGSFGGAITGHVSHQNGLDADLRLPRRDGVEGPSGPGTYDRRLTQALVDRLVAQGAALVLVGPSLDLHGPRGIVGPWPNHDDHIHVRFPDPDGPGN